MDESFEEEKPRNLSRSKKSLWYHIRETQEIREIEKTQREFLEDEFYFLLNELIQRSQHVYIYSRVPSSNNQLTDSYYTC